MLRVTQREVKVSVMKEEETVPILRQNNLLIVV